MHTHLDTIAERYGFDREEFSAYAYKHCAYMISDDGMVSTWYLNDLVYRFKGYTDTLPEWFNGMND